MWPRYEKGMTMLLLIPKTKKGKQVSKRDGSRWAVVDSWARVPAFDNRPGVLIESMKNQARRWIEPDGSPHFQVLDQMK